MEKFSFFSYTWFRFIKDQDLKDYHDLEEGPGRKVFHIVTNLTHALNFHLYGRGQVLSFFPSKIDLKIILSYG